MTDLPRSKLYESPSEVIFVDPTLWAVIAVPGIFAISPTTSASYFCPLMRSVVSLLSSVSTDREALIPSAMSRGILGIGALRKSVSGSRLFVSLKSSFDVLSSD